MRATIPIAVAMTFLFTGCTVPKTQPQPSQLLGSWKTGTVQTEWGPSILQVTFHNASDLEFTMTPIGGKESLASKGKYRLSGKQLTSEAINKGEPVSIWLEKDRLVIQTPSQPPRRFTRQ